MCTCSTCHHCLNACGCPFYLSRRCIFRSYLRDPRAKTTCVNPAGMQSSIRSSNRYYYWIPALAPPIHTPTTPPPSPTQTNAHEYNCIATSTTTKPTCAHAHILLPQLCSSVEALQLSHTSRHSSLSRSRAIIAYACLPRTPPLVEEDRGQTLAPLASEALPSLTPPSPGSLFRLLTQKRCALKPRRRMPQQPTPEMQRSLQWSSSPLLTSTFSLGS